MPDPEVHRSKLSMDKKKGEEEMETHEQFLSMAGIMYSSLKQNWKKTGSDGKKIKEIQPKITKNTVHKDARTVGIQTKIHTSGRNTGRVRKEKDTAQVEGKRKDEHNTPPGKKT